MDKELTLERLEIFARTAEAPSFRAAAKQMGMSEPCLSGHIAALERNFGGVQLFERQRGIRARTTALGRDLLPRIKQLLRDAQDLRDFAENWQEGSEKTTISIACYPVHLERFLASVIKQFLQEHPRVRMDLSRVRDDRQRHIGRSLFEELQDGEADFSLGPSHHHLGFDGIKAYEARIRLLLPNGHEAKQTAQVSLEILKELPILIAPPNHYSRQKVERACQEAGFGLKIAGESTSPLALYALGNAGVGVPVLPDDHSLADVDYGEYPILLDVYGNELCTAVWLHWRKIDHPPAVTAFIECAKKWADADLRTPRIAVIGYGKK